MDGLDGKIMENPTKFRMMNMGSPISGNHHMGVSKVIGIPPSHHPFRTMGFFHKKTIHIFGVPPLMETPIYLLVRFTRGMDGLLGVAGIMKITMKWIKIPSFPI